MAIWCHNYNVTDPILQWTRSKQNEIIAFLRDWLNANHRVTIPAAITRFTEMFADRVCGLGNIRSTKAESRAPIFSFMPSCPGARKKGQILALGHSDTVYPTRHAREHAVSARRRADYGDRGCSI